MKCFDANSVAEVLARGRVGHVVAYYSFYSSLWEAMTRDTALMVVPFDDHLVHRGDGVFESMKCLDGAIYNLKGHLARLERSAGASGLDLPGGLDGVRSTVLDFLRETGVADCSLRLIISRGPGGMGVSPAESAGSVMYLMTYQLGTPFMKLHPEGAKLGSSAVAVKPPMFAVNKNCNYLPNVLMKGEALAGGFDFMVGVDADGYVTEGATENIGMVSQAGELVFPALECMLTGTTMLRAVAHAEALVVEGALTGTAFRRISREELAGAREILIVGTTLNVVSVVSFDGRAVGSGKPGAIALRLNELIEKETKCSAELRTRFLDV